MAEPAKREAQNSRTSTTSHVRWITGISWRGAACLEIDSEDELPVGHLVREAQLGLDEHRVARVLVEEDAAQDVGAEVGVASAAAAHVHVVDREPAARVRPDRAVRHEAVLEV